ncbi:MAG: pentapeptide repeat-containing protein [Galactobacter sp.]|uniref:pentapeptide repeat-containing protein n=1 Tax=Galactobacter sp. TaxID=2676125 RepID=UPI0025BA29A3|nr:pentapeptide repeat-containing protein [Galactobacter sp.]
MSAPVAPRVPLGDPSVTGRDGAWGDFGLGGEFDGVRLSGRAADALGPGPDGGAADLTDVTFRDCVLAGADLSQLRLDRCRWEGSLLEDVFADRLAAARSGWRHMVVRRMRAGLLDLVDAKVNGLYVTQAKIGSLDLRRASVSDVLIEDASIEDLDLSEARVTRLALRDVRVARLVVAGAVLRDVDLRSADLRTVGPVAGLRGAVISARQLEALAPAFAEEFGLRVL